MAFTGRNNHPEVTVERILEVAAKLFLEKGYENTTIQNIIDGVGMSKGAIYHHFKSKEDIINTISNRFGQQLISEMLAMRNRKDLTALEKLRGMFLFALRNAEQAKFSEAIQDVLDNPKFLALQLKSTVYEVAPQIVEPLLREGIADGSIPTKRPKALAEVIMMLVNIWMNPYIFRCTQEEYLDKYCFFADMMEQLGLPIFDDEIFLLVERQREKVRTLPTTE